MWTQVGHEDRWELKRDERVVATVWHEGNYWHWSVPGTGMPRRGADHQFRVAMKQAEEAGK